MIRMIRIVGESGDPVWLNIEKIATAWRNEDGSAYVQLDPDMVVPVTPSDWERIEGIFEKEGQR